MARLVTKRMADALRAGAPMALLGEFDHPDGLQRYWTGIGTLRYGGNDFTGTGILGTVTGISYVSDLSIQQLQFSINRLEGAALGDVSFDVAGRSVRVWLACLSPAGRVVPDPFQVIDASMDYAKLPVDDSGQNSILTIFAMSGFYTLERAIDEVHSPEDQRARFPGDSGFDLLTAIQQQTVIWTPT